MRKAYLLFTLLMIGLASCKPKQNDKPTTYAVSNVHDIGLSQGQTYTYDVFLNYLGPVQENVILTMEGLPAGISVHFSKTGGIPSFGSTITLRNNSTEPGDYPCELITTGAQTGRKVHKFNINVSTEPLCGTLGNYTYNLTMLCSPALFGGILTTAETVTGPMVPVQNAVNPVRFNNFGGYAGLVVSANIDCATSRITIPIQSVTLNGDTREIGGNGSFTPSGMTVNYSIYSSGPTVNCSFTMLKTN